MTKHTALFSRVLIPYDGCPPAQTALRYGVELARHGAELTIMNAACDALPALDVLDAQARRLLDDAVAQCRHAGVVPATQIVHDEPDAAILAASDALGADLIIMGTHARTGASRFFMGSTTERVLQCSTTPVMVVRSGDFATSDLFENVLAAVDEGPSSDAALAVAGQIAHVAGARVIAVHVLDQRTFYDSALAYGFDPRERASEDFHAAQAMVAHAISGALAGPHVHAIVLEGEPASTIVAASKEQHTGCIVIGTNGRRGLKRAFLGSVAEGVVRRSDVPVIVVREHVRSALARAETNRRETSETAR